jgi:ribosomal protein S18 acetylase RimI-like enzyme
MTEESRKVILRSPEPGDWGWILSKNEEIFVNEYGITHRPLAAYVASSLADIITKAQVPGSGCRSWMAEVDGVTVGCINCIREDETTARIKLFIVLPEARGCGIGTRLVKELIQFARDSGYSKIVLFTTSIQTAGLRLYEKLGFQFMSTRKLEGFGAELDEVNLELVL